MYSAFIDGGKLKTGMDLGAPVIGGSVGLLTNALGTGVGVAFDSLIVGPLEVQ